MRICLLARFFNTRSAGMGRVSEELLKYLLSRGHSLDLICSTLRGMGGYLLHSALQVPLSPIPRDVDVYHALSPLEAIWTPRDRTVVTFHDLIPWLHLGRTETHYAGGRLRRLKAASVRCYFEVAARAAAQCRRIICISEQTRREVIDNLDVDESKISVARLGIPEDLKPMDRTADDTYRIGTLSYLDPRKRIDILIRAFREADLDGAELVIAGRGEDRARLEAIAGNDERIKFLGFVEDLNAFYNRLKVFVFPSALEGYGLPMVEAMACGLPVVTLDDAMIPADVMERTHVSSESLLPSHLEDRRFDCDISDNLEFARAHSWRKFGEVCEAAYGEVARGGDTGSCLRTLLEIERVTFPDESCFHCPNLKKCRKLEEASAK